MDKSEPIFTRNFVLLVTAYMLCLMGLNMQLPLMPLYISSIGGSQLDVGLVMGVMGLVAIFARFPLGHHVDARGRKMVFLAGIACFLVAFASYPLCTSAVQVMAVRVLNGAGLAALVLAGVALVVDAAPRARLGEAVGYYTGLGTTSMVFGPAIGGAILDVAGYRVAFWVAAALALVALALAAGVRERFQPSAGPRAGFRTVARNPGLVTACVIGFSVALCFVTMGTYFPLMASGQGINASQIGLFFSVYGVALIASRPAMGGLSDRVGRMRLVAPLMLVAALAFLLLAAASGFVQYAALAVVFGVSMGPSQSISAALAVDTIPPQQRGKAIALHANSFDAGMAVGPMALGLVAQQQGYPVLFLSLSAMMLAGLVLAIVAARGLPPKAR